MGNTVLLVPEANDPLHLLKPGLCGARPPIVYLGPPPEEKWITNRWNDSAVQALVLAWEGEVSPEGCDRAMRVLAKLSKIDARCGLQWRAVIAKKWCLEGWGDRKEFDTPTRPPEPASSDASDIGHAWALATVLSGATLGKYVAYYSGVFIPVMVAE